MRLLRKVMRWGDDNEREGGEGDGRMGLGMELGTFWVFEFGIVVCWRWNGRGGGKKEMGKGDYGGLITKKGCVGVWACGRVGVEIIGKVLVNLVQVVLMRFWWVSLGRVIFTVTELVRTCGWSGMGVVGWRGNGA